MEGYDNYHNKLNIYIKIELFYVIISIFDFLFSTVHEIEYFLVQHFRIYIVRQDKTKNYLTYKTES